MNNQDLDRMLSQLQNDPAIDLEMLSLWSPKAAAILKIRRAVWY